MKIKVILKEKIKNLGVPGDVALVAKGYARNWLVPNDKAIIATKSALLDLEGVKLTVLSVQADKLILAQQCVALLTNAVIRTPVRADNLGRLYGTLTKPMIIERIHALHTLPTPLDKKHLKIMEGSIKMIGTYAIDIQFLADVNVKIQIIVEHLDISATRKA
jgi:large subunit ribosomal protein L9